MNVGYFIHKNWYPPRAGSGVHAYQVATHLMERGHTLSTVFTDVRDPRVERYRRRQLPSFLRAIDAIYIRIFGGAQTGKYGLLKLLRRRRCPVVWEVNAPLEEQLLTGKSHRDVEALHRRRRLLAPTMDGCICVSQTLADYAERTWGSKHNFVIPSGSDPDVFTPQARSGDAYPELTDRFKVVWAGTPQFRWHGVSQILAAARRMEAADPDVAFILIGKLRHFRPYEPLPSNVRLVDEQPYLEMPRLLASADVGLCLYEALDIGVDFYRSPLKLFDSMSSGLVTIVTSERETRKIIRHGENGLLMDEGDTGQLVAMIREVKRDTAWAASMGKQSRADVEGYYNWGRVARDTEAALRSLM